MKHLVFLSIAACIVVFFVWVAYHPASTFNSFNAPDPERVQNEKTVRALTTPEAAPLSVVEPQGRLLSRDALTTLLPLLIEARQQIAEQRSVICWLGSPSSYETVRCLRLLDKLESCRARLEEKLKASTTGDSLPPNLDDVREFIALGKQYEAAGVEFKKEGRRKQDALYKSN